MTNQRLIRNAAVITVDPELGTLPKADILLLSLKRLGLASGASPERIAVLQANGGDVDTVLVAGEVRKRHGVLVDVDTEAVARDLDVARERVFAAHAAHDMTPYRGIFEQIG